MTWTYSGNPASSAIDAVRFNIGDTDSADEQLQNEEISYLLTQNGNNVISTSIQACTNLAAKYARRADRDVGDLKVKWSQLQKHYRELAATLRRTKLANGDINVMAGGVYDATGDADRANSAILQPRFKRGQFNNPEDTSSGYDEDWS